MKVFKIDILNGRFSNPLIVNSLALLKDELEQIFDDWDQPLSAGSYSIELTEMDTAEFEALEEWDGF
jgi:hypothetical protein